MKDRNIEAPEERQQLFDSIVVGVDDDRSDCAVSAALELGSRLGCELSLLHAVSAPDARREPEKGPELAELGFERQVRRLETTFAGKALDARERLRVLLGKPSQVLLERAYATPNPLLVLGPHRQRGKIDFGSTARAVLTHSRAPVWVQMCEPHPIRNILVPVELTGEKSASEASSAVLELARELARAHGARVTVLHSFVGPALAYAHHAPLERGPPPTYVVDEVFRAAGKQLDRLVAEFDWGEVPHACQIEEAAPIEHILRSQDSADLIVIGSRVRSVPAGLLLGSTVFGVLQGASKPVLTLPVGK